MADFFISFNSKDKRWSDWIAWNLDYEGFSIIYQPWHFLAGSNFVLEMDRAIKECDRTIAVLTDNYIESLFTSPEWAAAFARDPLGYKRKLIPIRVKKCDISNSLLSQIVYIDLVGVNEEQKALRQIFDNLGDVTPSERPEVLGAKSDMRPPFPRSINNPMSGTKNKNSIYSALDSLPPPGMRLSFSPSFTPPLFKGVKVYQNNPLLLDFLLDTGDGFVDDSTVAGLSSRLVKYFFSSLTVAEENQWVNMSPYEPEMIIPDEFSCTEMGLDLLAQDYILKQLTASSMFPERKIGREIWETFYSKYNDKNTWKNPDVNTFNKIWITPESAEVVEDNDMIMITNSKLKTQLEKDFIAQLNHAGSANGFSQTLHATHEDVADDKMSEVVKNILIPRMSKEVNEGSNFAVLRQIFFSMILAVWYRSSLKNTVIGGEGVGPNGISGVTTSDKEQFKHIYEQYKQSFEIGCFNYIREFYNPVLKEDIPRKYFSGGFSGTRTRSASKIKPGCPMDFAKRKSEDNGKQYWVRVRLIPRIDDTTDGPENGGGPGNPGGIHMSSEIGFKLNVTAKLKRVEFKPDSDSINTLERATEKGLIPKIEEIVLID